MGPLYGSMALLSDRSYGRYMPITHHEASDASSNLCPLRFCSTATGGLASARDHTNMGAHDDGCGRTFRGWRDNNCAGVDVDSVAGTADASGGDESLSIGVVRAPLRA